MNVDEKYQAVVDVLEAIAVDRDIFNVSKNISHVPTPTILVTPHGNEYMQLDKIAAEIEDATGLDATVEPLGGAEVDTIRVQ